MTPPFVQGEYAMTWAAEILHCEEFMGHPLWIGRITADDGGYVEYGLSLASMPDESEATALDTFQKMAADFEAHGWDEHATVIRP